VRPSSTAMSTKLSRVKRHHASSSGPMLGSEPVGTSHFGQKRRFDGLAITSDLPR
jgi:hypothetical protein